MKLIELISSHVSLYMSTRINIHVLSDYLTNVPEHTHAYSGLTNCRIFTNNFLISVPHTPINPFNIFLLKPALFSN